MVVFAASYVSFTRRVYNFGKVLSYKKASKAKFQTSHQPSTGILSDCCDLYVSEFGGSHNILLFGIRYLGRVRDKGGWVWNLQTWIPFISWKSKATPQCNPHQEIGLIKYQPSLSLKKSPISLGGNGSWGGVALNSPWFGVKFPWFGAPPSYPDFLHVWFYHPVDEVFDLFSSKKNQ